LLAEFRPRSRKTFFEWRAFLGANTTILDGEETLAGGPGPRSIKRFRISVAGLGGLLLAKIVHWGGGIENAPGHDPTFEDRLAELEAQSTDVIQTAPRLSDTQVVEDEVALILVHGTVASCVPAAQTLVARGLHPYRFEHDTFASIGSNARLLADLLMQVRSPRVVIVGHSRGGLVARRAAQLVSRTGDGPTIDVISAGTPHEGTPFINSARNVRAFWRLAVLAGDLRGVSDPWTSAMRYAMFTRNLPIGLTAMTPGSDALELISQDGCPCVAACGGVFDPAAPGVSYGLAFGGGFARTLFGGQQNDLVVSVTSATAGGKPFRLTEPCAHFAYFEDAELLTLIEERL
jgi:pimeloyl-ACP methyl ester carboxylesterase